MICPWTWGVNLEPNQSSGVPCRSKKKVLEALHSRYRLPPKSGERRNKMMCLTDFLSLCFDVGLYTGVRARAWAAPPLLQPEDVWNVTSAMVTGACIDRGAAPDRPRC